MSQSTDPDPQPGSTSSVPVATIEHDNSALEDFVEQNKSKLILAMLALLVIIVAFLVMRYLKESGVSEAAAALTGAESVEELDKVIADFPKETVAGSAALMKVTKLSEADKDDEAYEALKQFVETHKNHPLYYKGVADLGLREHAKGNLDEAITHLKEASLPGNAPAFIEQTALQRLGDALIAKGREAMQSGDEAAAKGLFEEAKTAFTDLETKAPENSVLRRTAEQRKDLIPHLSVVPLTPEEGKQKAEEAAAKVAEEAAAAAAEAEVEGEEGAAEGEEVEGEES